MKDDEDVASEGTSVDMSAEETHSLLDEKRERERLSRMIAFQEG